MKRLLLAGVGLMTLAASSAVAADLPASMPTKAPPMMYQPYNWSGWYLGINGGYGWGNSNWVSPPPLVSTGNFDVDGGMVGGTLGVNWQSGAWVFGLEGDIDWSDIKGSAACGALNCETSNNWFGTFRGRVGYAFDRFLPYFTGGLAVGNVEAGGLGLGTESDTRAGWTVGAGVEWAVNGPWTAKVEYLYADLGKTGCNIACGGPTDVKFDANIVRAGINYRFGGGPAPVGGYPGGY